MYRPIYMKSVLRKIILLAICMVVCLLCAWVVYRNFIHSEKEIRMQIERLFNECLRSDKDARELETPFFYFFTLFPDNEKSGFITIQSEDSTIYIKKPDEIEKMNSEEKKYVLSQLYLLDRNPIRVCSLDSLFCNELSQNNIPAKIAIVYEAKGEKYCSTVDTSFYKSAWKLKEVVIGFQRDIVLQVYAKLPASYIIAQSLPVYTLVLLILVLSVVGGILFLRGNKKIAVLLAPKVQRDGILLRSDVLYDKENGVLVYADQEITLTNYKLELFNLLLENNGQYVASDILQSAVWPDGLSTKDALMQTVKRLRMDLKEIPFLKVENLRGNGYRLLIEPV